MTNTAELKVEYVPITEQTGRVCYMAELDPKYADVILKRFEEFTGQAPELIEDAKTE